jgi:hypothetical protein
MPDPLVVERLESPQGKEVAFDRCERQVQDAKEAVLSLLTAFAGLEFVGLIPGLSPRDPIAEDSVDGVTVSNTPSVIAALKAWEATHPGGAFEVALLIPKLRALMRARIAAAAFFSDKPGSDR